MAAELLLMLPTLGWVIENSRIPSSHDDVLLLSKPVNINLHFVLHLDGRRKFFVGSKAVTARNSRPYEINYIQRMLLFDFLPIIV